ncbi:MAG: CBS domain-containing protein [Bacteroidota bacterium]
MNILTPVNDLMTTDLITVHPKDTLAKVKEHFDNNSIHHIPVVEFKKIVGIISKTDLLYFLKGTQTIDANFENEARLAHHQVSDFMTTGLATTEPSEPIRTALEIFKENLFHALPVVQNEELLGILTTYDLIVFFANEAVRLEDYAAQK